MFIKYLPLTFKYSDVNNARDNFIAEEEGDDAPAVPEYNFITGERIRHMAAALAAGFSIKSSKSDAIGGISNNSGSSSAGT